MRQNSGKTCEKHREIYVNIEKYVIKGQYKWPCERKYNGIGERAREKRIIHAIFHELYIK